MTWNLCEYTLKNIFTRKHSLIHRMILLCVCVCLCLQNINRIIHVLNITEIWWTYDIAQYDLQVSSDIINYIKLSMFSSYMTLECCYN